MRYLLLILPALLLCGCESTTDDGLQEEDVLTVIDHAHASVALLPIYPLIRALQTGTGSWSSIGTRTCAQVDSIVGDTATFPGGGPVTVYLRYAAGGCTDVDGRVRDGSLVVVLNTAVGAEAGDFNAYSTGLELSGLKVRFGMHGNAAGEIQEVTMDSSFIWQAGAWSPRFTGALSYTNTVGSTTLQPDDDTYSLTHVLDGKDRHGATYSSNTSEAMTIGTTCRWATAGKEIILPAGLGQRILDHGTGTCDGYTSIAVGGQTIGLTIP